MAPHFSNPTAVTLVVAILLACGCGDKNQPGPPNNTSPEDPGVATPAPPRAESEFQNTGEEVTYVGSRQCAGCHTEQHATWKTSSHARSMIRVSPDDEPPDATFEHKKSGRAYEVLRVESKLRHRESLILRDGTKVPLSDHPLEFLVGSGRFSRTYLVELEGTLVESPVTWYAQRQAWDMSPGYDYRVHRSFRRRATHSCLLCHAGLVDPSPPRGFTFPHNEISIGCERCHGPGSRHVAHHAATDQETGNTSRDSPDFSIVNPRRLDRPLAEAICQQCHLQADVKVTVRGRRPGDFRPGLPLSDERIEYRLTGSGLEMTVVGHVDQLRASRCYQQDPRLSCVTCHDSHNPHRPKTAAARDRLARTKCLQCHQAGDCGEAKSTRMATQPVADSCAGCHMPRVDTDIPHIAFRHHRIAVFPAETIRDTGDTEPNLAAVDQLTTIQDLSRFSQAEQDRMLGLAYYRLHFQRPWQHGEFLARANKLLETAATTIRGDAALDAARAEIAWETRQVPAASRWADRVLDMKNVESSIRAMALHVKAQVLMERGDLKRAIPLIRELTTIRRDPLDWAQLGHCQSLAGDTAGAISSFQQVLVIAPGQGAIHKALAPLYERAGDSDKARKHRAEARRLPPGGFRSR
ncbi:MAG: multiheme c-type cytochrome [Planctomycetota bacterium]|nr:multiheme c-type cytochrome [Planctomycetota bacterium]